MGLHLQAREREDQIAARPRQWCDQRARTSPPTHQQVLSRVATAPLWNRPRCARCRSPPREERERRRRSTWCRRSSRVHTTTARYLRCVTASSSASRHVSGAGIARKGRERRVLVLGGRQKLSAAARHPAPSAARPSRVLQAVTVPRRPPRARRALDVRRPRQRPQGERLFLLRRRYQARWPWECRGTISERAIIGFL